MPRKVIISFYFSRFRFGFGFGFAIESVASEIWNSTKCDYRPDSQLVLAQMATIFDRRDSFGLIRCIELQTTVAVIVCECSIRQIERELFEILYMVKYFSAYIINPCLTIFKQFFWVEWTFLSKISLHKIHNLLKSNRILCQAVVTIDIYFK